MKAVSLHMDFFTFLIYCAVCYFTLPENSIAPTVVTPPSDAATTKAPINNCVIILFSFYYYLLWDHPDPVLLNFSL